MSPNGSRTKARSAAAVADGAGRVKVVAGGVVYVPAGAVAVVSTCDRTSSGFRASDRTTRRQCRCRRCWRAGALDGSGCLSAGGARGRNPHGEARTFRYPRWIGSLPEVVMTIARPADITRAGSDVPIGVADSLVPIDVQGLPPRAPVVRPNRFYIAEICVGDTCAQTGQSYTAGTPTRSLIIQRLLAS
jgi:hypothetical protein